MASQISSQPPLDAAPGFGLAFFDPQLRLVRADAAFRDIAGLAEQAAGLAADTLLPAATPALAPLLAEALTERRAIVDLLLAERDGARRWLVSLHPLVSRVGVALGVDVILSRLAGPAAADRHSAERLEHALDHQRFDISQAAGPFRAVFDQADLGIVLTAPRGGLVAANPGFCAMVGYSAEDLHRLHPHELTHPDDQARELQQIEALLAEGVASAIEQRYRRRDGAEVWARVSRGLIRGPDGAVQLCLMIVQNINDACQAEAALSAAYAAEQQARQAAERAAERAERLLTLTAALSRALSPEGVAEAVVGEGLLALGASFGALAVLEADQRSLRLISSRNLSAQDLERWARIPLTVATPLTDAVRRGEPVWLSGQTSRSAHYPDLAAQYPYPAERAWAALPLFRYHQVIGALGLTFPGERPFDPEERTYLTTVAGLCAQALERARLMDSERQALASADEALALLDTLIDSAPIGLAFLDRDFRYRRVNQALARFNRRPPAEHHGRLARELFPDHAPLWEQHWESVQATGAPMIDLELSGGAEDGDAEGGPQALASYYPVRSGDGELLGVGVIVQDVTERTRAERERARLLASAQAARAAEQAARARAEEALQLRDTFLSVAAHELKNPLTALLGQAQLLQRRMAGELSPANQRSIDVILSQTRRLNQLVGDMLDSARIESGQLTIDRRSVDLAQLLRRIVDELQPTLTRHELRVIIPDAPLIAEVDPTRIEQVLQNLLSNALKYSPGGGLVTLRVARQGDQVELEVSDQGLGIPAEVLPLLFNRFYRAPTAEAIPMSGAGIGLYVVREIVQRHGGQVRVESAVGRGSSFLVTLPLRSAG